MKKIFISALLVALAGCSTQTALISGTSGKLAKEDMQTFFVSGIGQNQTLDAAQICGGADKVVKVEKQVSFLNGLLSSLTSNIYTPRQARVYCK